MKWKMTAHYGLIQGALWGLYVPLFAFGSMYLLAKRLTNTQVGYVIAAGSAASVLIQPMFGSLADRSRKNILHRLITALTVLMVLLSAILLAEGNLPWLSAILFSLLICIIFVITPLTYSLGIFFMERGAEINFGICRGTGSLVYSVISVWMGIAAARTNEDIVVWAIIVLCVLTIGAVCSFHFRGIDEKKKVQDTDGTSSAGGVILFLREHRAFAMILIGIVLVFVNHNIIGFYLYQIMVWHGYTARELGFASTLMAVCEMPALFFLSFINSRISTRTLFRTSVIFMFLKSLCLLLAGNITMIYLSLCLQLPGYGLYAGTSILFAKETIEPEYQSTAQTLLSSAISVGSVIGSMAGGWFLDYAGVQKTLILSVLSAASGAVIVNINAAPPGN